MRNLYTREELLAILEIERFFGPLTYQKPSDVEVHFYELTGHWRASGCIYMAYWRIRQGKYERLLEGVTV
jgi:hypothetical protein